MGHVNWGELTAGEEEVHRRDGRSQKLPVLGVMLKGFILKQQGSRWGDLSRTCQALISPREQAARRRDGGAAGA